MSDQQPLRIRAFFFLIFCGGVLAWNMALSTRRIYFSGKLIPVKQEDLVLKVSCAGKIEPKVQETLRSVVDGPKKNVFVKEGEPVKKGQLLMEIGEDTIRVELTTKRNTLRNSQVDYARAKKENELSIRLYNQMAIPKHELENAGQALDRAGQAVQSAKYDLATSVKKAQGVKIYSPLDGIVLKIFVEAESSITAGKELIKVAQMDHFIVRGQVDELDMSQITLGQEAIITCDAFAGTSLKGSVAWIGAQAGENAFADIPILLDITETQGLALKPNLSAEAKIVVGKVPHAIVIPAGAVRKKAEGSYVLRASRAGWLTEQQVTVKRVNADEILILDGLKPAQTVLVPPEE